MAGNAAKNLVVCNACGADVRPQALFCYNCGASVAPEFGGGNNDRPATDETVLSRAETGEAGSGSGGNNISSSQKVETIDTKNRKRTKRDAGRRLEKTSAAPSGKFPAETEKLKTAASIRKNSPPVAGAAAAAAKAKRKTVEVVWETPEAGAPNLWFIAAAFVLALFAGAILLAALYLR